MFDEFSGCTAPSAQGMHDRTVKITANMILKDFTLVKIANVSDTFTFTSIIITLWMFNL